MTASQLVNDIFSRVQPGLDSNMRRVTRKQFDWLRALILDEEENGTVHHGKGDSLVWAPAGRNKFVLTEDTVGQKHTLTRLSNLVPAGMGRLF